MRSECHPELGLLLVDPNVPEEQARAWLADAIIAICCGEPPEGTVPLGPSGPYGAINGDSADTA